MILGFCGAAGSGKTSACAYLRSEFGAVVCESVEEVPVRAAGAGDRMLAVRNISSAQEAEYLNRMRGVLIRIERPSAVYTAHGSAYDPAGALYADGLQCDLVVPNTSSVDMLQFRLRSCVRLCQKLVDKKYVQ
ncbi:MAG: hypothetical protein L7S67_10915 [Flavobacteriales bacterium]|nr:hypothetical protein [Flavobacteriales bacterium]